MLAIAEGVSLILAANSTNYFRSCGYIKQQKQSFVSCKAVELLPLLYQFQLTSFDLVVAC